MDRAENCSHHARIGRDKIFTGSRKQFPQMQNPRMWQEGDMYAVEFNIPTGTFQGRKTRGHDMYAHWVRDGIWLDFHLSKAPYEEKDRRLVLDFLNSVRFVPAGR